MPVQHVAALHGLDWGTVHRAELHALERWDKTRKPPPLRHVGIDEKYLGRRNKLAADFVTIVSNVETGEPLWIGYGRSEKTVAQWLTTLTAEQKTAVDGHQVPREFDHDGRRVAGLAPVPTVV